MKVEKISLNSYGNMPRSKDSGGTKLYANRALNTNFTGGIPQADLVKDIQQLMPKTIKATNRLADSMGEIQNIIINAVGTGLVAPIFIKYNPLSKTDEDTRTYSAWRQPLSAVLAIATQASMVAPFNNLINWMANTGKLPDPYNKTNFQDDKYIAKIIKKTQPNLSKEQLGVAVKKEQERQYKELLENLRNQNTIFIKQHKMPSKPMDEASYKNLLLETVDSMIKEDNKKLENCGTTKQKRAIRSEFFRKHNDYAKQVMSGIQKDTEKYATLDEYRNYLSGKIKSLKSEQADQELISMIKEIQDRAQIKPHDENAEKALIKEVQNKITKMLKQVNTYSNILSEEDVMKHVDESIQTSKSALENSISTLNDIKTKLNTAESISIKEIEKRIAQKLKEGNITDECSIKTSFATKVIEKYKSNIEGSLKGYKQFTGLVISLAVLPVSCYLLNWIYPSFMDALFPNLSNKKHDNEASALVAKAPKKEEV